MDSTAWDERYGSSTSLWSGEPNPQLSAVVEHLTPGRALEAGCGEGADAVWLAEKGWQVTAVDFSSVALERAAAHAAERGTAVADRITWMTADLMDWKPPPGAFDLVSCQFVHLPADQRHHLHHRLATAVAPGGMLLLVGHHPLDLTLDIRRPDRANLFDGEEVLRALGVQDTGVDHEPSSLERDGAPPADRTQGDRTPGNRTQGDRAQGAWRIVVDEARPRRHTDSEGNPVTLHDTVVALRRTAS